jgi:hypothetical protein
VFFEQWLEPGMHLGAIRPAATEIERAAWDKIDVIAILDHEDAPTMIYTHGVRVGEDKVGTGMGMPHDAFHASLPTLPAIMTGRARAAPASARSPVSEQSRHGIPASPPPATSSTTRRAVASARGSTEGSREPSIPDRERIRFLAGGAAANIVSGHRTRTASLRESPEIIRSTPRSMPKAESCRQERLGLQLRRAA